MRKKKRMQSFLTVGVLLLATIFSFSGCGNYVPKESLQASLEKVLEEQYQESFTCLNVWGSGGSSYVGVCYPDDEPDVVFEASFFCSKGKTTLHNDFYAAALASKIFASELEAQFGDAFPDCFVHCRDNVFTDTELTESIIQGTFSSDIYLEDMRERFSDSKLSLVYYICINTSAEHNPSYEEEYTLFNQAVEHIACIAAEHDFTFEATCFIYFLSSDIYSEAVSYFDTNYLDRASFYQIVEGEDRDKNRQIRMDYGETMQPYDIWSRETISKHDYVKMRKLLDP